MKTVRILFGPGLLAVVATAALLAQSREPDSGQRPPERQSLTPENFSPLGYDNLRAYEQAYPATVRHPELIRASLQKYWVFRGMAYRGRTNAGGVWTSLGPETTIQDPDAGSTETVSGRVAA
ncbi:MAG TPA: hypothetical protein VF424_15295, partial [Vicinamibacterales bacterium]